MDGKTSHIGILGGTFDPVHNAHLALAGRAYEQFSLDEVWMLPNGNPPHKWDSRQADVSDRVNMIRLAAAGRPYLRLCDIECDSAEYHYTYETLTVLNSRYPDTQFYFIMGADSLFEFAEWRRPDIISKKCVILAAVRDHCRKDQIAAQIRLLKERFGADIRMLDTPDMDIASEDIRRAVLEGRDVSGLLPEAVERYIRSRGLYHSV